MMKYPFAVILLATLGMGCKEKVQEVKPQEKSLTSAVYASGTLVPEEEYKVMSSVDGYLTQSLVTEGDTVKKGQLLFRVSSEVRTTQERTAAELVQKTLPTVVENAPTYRELQGRIEVARIRQQQDSLQYVRYKNLYDQDATSQSNYEKFYLQYQSSLKEYQNLKRQLEQQRLAGRIQLQQAQNQLAMATAQADVGELKSYVDGIVYDIYKENGDIINPSQPIALVGAGKMIARLSIDEDDLDKVFVGQAVLITMDAYGDRIFKARIARIYPILNKVEQSFRADAVLDEAVAAGVYGLNLEANIVVAENRKVMAIPKTALLKGDSVIIKKADKEVKVKIKKGIEDDNWVEVVSGLDRTSTIIIK